MKKITLLFLLQLFTTGFSQAIDLQELISRYELLPTNGNSPKEYFTPEELQHLRAYLNTDQSQMESEGGGIVIYGPNTEQGDFVFFSTESPQTFTLVGSDSGTADFESSGDIDPTNLTTAYVLTLGIGEFYEVDITTATYTSLGTISPPVGQQWNGIEFDSSTNTLYGISSNFNNQSTLSTIDIDNMTSKPIGDTGTIGAIAIATDGIGNFYMYDVVDDNFYTLNPDTGFATFVGQLGFDANFGQDLEWDAETGQLFMTAFNNGNLNAELRLVNLQTGNAQYLGDLSNGDDAQFPWASVQNESTLSTVEFDRANISLFPNPSKGIVTINSNIIFKTLNIYNVNGQRLMAITKENTKRTYVNLSALSNGVYFVEIIGEENQKIIQKFVKN